MSELLSEYVSREPQKMAHVESLLNSDNKWKNLAQSLKSYRVSICFTPLQLAMMERSCSPTFFLLNELMSRRCSIGVFRDILRKNKELDVLGIISDPESLNIIIQPGDNDEIKYICCQDDLVLECVATGIPPPKYQWYCDNRPLDNLTGSIMKVPDFRMENEGEYYCVVSHIVNGEEETITSNSIICNIMDSLPQFLDKPSSVSQSVGSNVCFQVDVTCSSRYKLQWIKGNTILSGETSNLLCIKNIQKEHAGNYMCIASNSAGEVYSSVIELKVNLKRKKKRPPVKVALLIANADYSHYNRLCTPCNDAILLADKLTSMKFKVITLINLTLIEMKNIVDWFFDLLPPGSYACFCFIGHGFMLSGNKFMMPIDCPNISEFRMSDCICDKYLIMKAKTKKLKLLLMVLDMCLKVPNGDENKEIYNERTKEYVYEPFSHCELICLFSTSSHQSAYENTNHQNGIYIEHLSKYIDRDEPIHKIIEAANQDFSAMRFSQLQKPSVLMECGEDIKLIITPSGDDNVDLALEKFSKLQPSYQELNFPRVNLLFPLVMFCHRKFIMNVIDLKFPEHFLSWNTTVSVHPGNFKYEITPASADGTGGPILTIYGIQRAMNGVSIIVKISRVIDDGSLIEDNAKVDLSLPCAVATLWYKPLTDEL